MFLSIIRNACLPKMQEFGINVRYNSRLDPDNLSFTTKIFVDVLRREGIVPDDTRKQYKYFNVVPDGELPENTAVFIIEHLK